MATRRSALFQCGGSVLPYSLFYVAQFLRSSYVIICQLEQETIFMMIFLDSSILCSNYYMKGPSFDIVQKVGTIVLGQIVMDEVCNKYQETLKEQYAKMRRSIEDVNKIASAIINVPDEKLVSEECKKYRDFLDMYIIESGMTVPEEYPSISHEKIVNRALQRKKPFKSDGSSGYRDYLVWETCLRLAEVYAYEDIHFISSNTRDFSDSNEREKLHPDLLDDLKERKISENRFHYWTSLKSFIDNCAGIIAADIDKRESIISEIQHNVNGFIQPINQFIENKLVGLNINDQDILIPGINAVLIGFDDLSNFDIEDVSNLNENESEYLLDIRIDGVGIVESNSDTQEIKEFEDILFDIEIINRHGNGKCTVRTLVGMKAHLRALYNKAKQHITSIELDYLDDYNCPYCPY